MNTGKQLGITLIELMVAMTLGLFIIAGTFSVYLTTNEVRRTNDRAARLQDTARIALETLTEEIKLAGYYGRVAAITDVVGYKDSAVTLMAAADDCETLGYIDLATPVNVINGAAGITPLDESSGGCIDSSEYIGETDVLVIRHASPEMHTSFGTSDLGDPFIRADLSRGELFIWDGNAANLPDASKFSATQVEDHKLEARYFYIGNHGFADGDNIPALRAYALVAESGAPKVEDSLVVPYIEGMQIQVGIDTNNDADADMFIDSPTASQIQQAVALRIWLLVRAEDPDFSFDNTATYDYGNKSETVNDNYSRLLVSQTVRLRNFKQSRF